VICASKNPAGRCRGGAGRLFIGESTVKTHVARVLAKLEVWERVQAVIVAYRGGLA
jgi:DNA-binding NarL/FixJ family response regulator